MNLVEKEEKFLEDLYLVDFEWLPDLEDSKIEYHLSNYDEHYEFTIKDRHIIRIKFWDSVIPRIPESITNLTHLEEVELSNNCFEKFPIEIFKIPKLKSFGRNQMNLINGLKL